MQLKAIRCYLVSAGVLLLVTSVAKLISATGSNRALSAPDPILALSFRNVLWLAGCVELLVALVCLFGRNARFQAALVTVLAVNFVVYRAGLWFVGWHRPCPCFGTMTQQLKISPVAADNFLQAMLAYLLAGGCLALWSLRGPKPGAGTASRPGDGRGG